METVSWYQHCMGKEAPAPCSPHASHLPAGGNSGQGCPIVAALADGKHPKSDASFFQRREFCFTLDGDIFVRYQSFKVCAHVRMCVCVIMCHLSGMHSCTM